MYVSNSPNNGLELIFYTNGIKKIAVEHLIGKVLINLFIEKILNLLLRIMQIMLIYL